jgi:hypothetical protein
MKIICLILLIQITAFAFEVKDHQITFHKLDDYSECMNEMYSDQQCYKELQKWVLNNPQDDFKAGKIVRVSAASQQAVPFFLDAFKAGRADCKDADVKLAVISGLSLPKSDTEIIESALQIGFKYCSSEMKEDLLKEAQLGTYFFNNTCLKFIELKMIKGLKEKKCKKL